MGANKGVWEHKRLPDSTLALSSHDMGSLAALLQGPDWGMFNYSVGDCIILSHKNPSKAKTHLARTGTSEDFSANIFIEYLQSGIFPKTYKFA